VVIATGQSIDQVHRPCRRSTRERAAQESLDLVPALRPASSSCRSSRHVEDGPAPATALARRLAWPRRGPRSRPSAGNSPQWPVNRAARPFSARDLGRLARRRRGGAHSGQSASRRTDRGSEHPDDLGVPGRSSPPTRWSATTASGRQRRAAGRARRPRDVYALFESVIATGPVASAPEQRGRIGQADGRRSPV